MKNNKKKIKQMGVIIIVLLFSVFAGGYAQIKEPSQKTKIDELIQQLGERNWREAVDALAEIGESAVPSLVQLVEERRRIKNNDVQSWLLTARIHYVLVKIESKTATDVVAETLLDEQANENIRTHAAMAIRDSQLETFISPLRKAYRSKNNTVRWKTVEALAEIGAEKSEDIFLEALKDEYLYVRGEATKILGNLKSIKSAPHMIGNFNDESWWVRLETRDALVRLGKPAENLLIDALKDKDSSTRWQAAWVLGTIQSEKAAVPLVEILSDQNWMVRDEASIALKSIQSKRSIKPLIVSLKDKREYVRKGAAWVLGEIKSEDAVDALIELLQNKVSGQDVSAALKKIGNLKGLMAVEQYLHEIEVQTPDLESIVFKNRLFSLYPQSLQSNPGIPSPYITRDGEEIILVYTTDNTYELIPVRVENGRPYIYTRFGKGRQLDVDIQDFPVLARTGLHSEQNLEQTKTITGRSVVEITELGRPGRSSGAGFMAEDEDIISVLKGDNRLVNDMELTHRDTSRVLFHLHPTLWIL